jgi:hypothetical protein
VPKEAVIKQETKEKRKRERRLKEQKRRKQMNHTSGSWREAGTNGDKHQTPIDLSDADDYVSCGFGGIDIPPEADKSIRQRNLIVSGIFWIIVIACFICFCWSVFHGMKAGESSPGDTLM